MIGINQLGLTLQRLQFLLVPLFVDTFQSLVIIGAPKTNQWIPIKTLFLRKYMYQIVVDVGLHINAITYIFFFVEFFLNVEDSCKQYLVQLAGKLHRCFRSYLIKKYLKNFDGNFKDCPAPYESLVSREEWETFVAKRKSGKFQVRTIY